MVTLLSLMQKYFGLGGGVADPFFLLLSVLKEAKTLSSIFLTPQAVAGDVPNLGRKNHMHNGGLLSWQKYLQIYTEQKSAV